MYITIQLYSLKLVHQHLESFAIVKLNIFFIKFLFNFF